MKTIFTSSKRGFSLVEIILAIVLFAGVSVAIWRLSSTSRSLNAAAASMAQQNVYSTLRAQIALQGLNPTTVTNFAAPALTDTGGTAVSFSNAGTDKRDMGFVRGLVASFESSAMKQATGASRAQPGAALRTAINYQTPTLSTQTSKGIGFGYSIGSTGVAVPSSVTQLAAPTFAYSGDLTSAPFPLNDIIHYPANPAGTTYRYTTDRSTPTYSSPIWNNNPAWTVSTFPYTVTITAFNSDPQYSPSAPVTATYTYTYTLSTSMSRVDGRADFTDFYYSDLQNPAATGIVLSATVLGATVYYTTDGSTPSQTNGVIYTGVFAPAAAAFNPTVTLNILATYSPSSPDPRYIYASAGTASYTLNPLPVTLPDPSILPPSGSLVPGVVITFSVPAGTPDAWLDGNNLGDVLDVVLQ